MNKKIRLFLSNLEILFEWLGRPSISLIMKDFLLGVRRIPCLQKSEQRMIHISHASIDLSRSSFHDCCMTRNLAINCRNSLRLSLCQRPKLFASSSMCSLFSIQLTSQCPKISFWTFGFQAFPYKSVLQLFCLLDHHLEIPPGFCCYFSSRFNVSYLTLIFIWIPIEIQTCKSIQFLYIL